MGSDCEAELPPEMIFEILTHTSLQTLEICKEVSDSWKKMTYDATFLPLHCKNTNLIFGYFFQNIKNHKFTSAFVAADAAAAENIKVSRPFADVEILASSDDGILCCQRAMGKNRRYYACKPSTKQVQALPNPKLRYETAAVAVVVVQHCPLRYIIVRLSERRGMQYNCEIFDSKNWAWEKVECATPYGEIVHPLLAGVTIGRSVHWLTTNDNVLMWDTSKSCFDCFPLPETVRGNDAYKFKQLMEYEDGLGLHCSVGDRMELWVLAERRSEWIRKEVVDMTVVGRKLKKEFDTTEVGEILQEPELWEPDAVEMCNTGVAFMKKGDEAVFYNIRCHSFHKVEVPYDLRYPQRIFRFRSDLESVELKGGR